MKARYILPLMVLMLAFAQFLGAQPSNPYYINTQSGG